MQVVQADVALTPGDKPNRVWVQNKQRVVMRHFQFGSVRVIASDGCHSKVLTVDGVQVMVCVENLEPIVGERCLPKRGQERGHGEGVGKEKSKREIGEEQMERYLNMGL